MFSVAREFSFSYGHRLYHYEGKCQRLHGHNARVRVEVAAVDATLNDQGMALDFVKLKETLGRWLDDELDHRVFLSSEDPLVKILVDAGDPPICFDGNPTAEAFAKRIYDRAREEGLNVVRVDFWETDKCRATYSR